MPSPPPWTTRENAGGGGERRRREDPRTVMESRDSPLHGPRLALSLSLSSLPFLSALFSRARATDRRNNCTAACCYYCRCGFRRTPGEGKKFTVNGASLVRLDALSVGVACTATHLRQYSSHAGRERGGGKTRGANVKMPAESRPCWLRASRSLPLSDLAVPRPLQASIRRRAAGSLNFPKTELAHSLLTATHTRPSLSLSRSSLYLSRLPFRVAYSSRTGFYLSRARRDRRRFTSANFSPHGRDRDTARTILVQPLERPARVTGLEGTRKGG